MKRIQSSDLKQIKFAMENALYELRWATKCVELNSTNVDKANEDSAGKDDNVYPQDLGKFGSHMPPHQAFKRQYGVTIEQMDEWIEWLE